MTYNEKRREVAVHGLLSDATSQFLVADEDGNRAASTVIADFKAGRDLCILQDIAGVDDTTFAIPYDAVQYIEVTETESAVSRDAYGCD